MKLRQSINCCGKLTLVSLRLCQAETFLQVPARRGQISFAERRQSQILERRRNPSLIIKLPGDREAFFQITRRVPEAAHQAAHLARAEEAAAPSKATFLSSCAGERLHRQPMTQPEQAAV